MYGTCSFLRIFDYGLLRLVSSMYPSKNWMVKCAYGTFKTICKKLRDIDLWDTKGMFFLVVLKLFMEDALWIWAIWN